MKEPVHHRIRIKQLLDGKELLQWCGTFSKPLGIASARRPFKITVLHFLNV